MSPRWPYARAACHRLFPSLFAPIHRMNIFSNTVVTLSYKLFSTTGELIEESAQPITYLHGGHHGIFPKIEAALAQKQVGDTCSVTLEPDDAFAKNNPESVPVEPQNPFPPQVKI